jgi:hypothetical protein
MLLRYPACLLSRTRWPHSLRPESALMRLKNARAKSATLGSAAAMEAEQMNVRISRESMALNSFQIGSYVMYCEIAVTGSLPQSS